MPGDIACTTWYCFLHSLSFPIIPCSRFFQSRGPIPGDHYTTWTVENDQDDIFDDWGNTALGEISNGTVSYRVNVSQHNGDVNCYYRTHIYAWDYSGNSSNESARDVFVDAQSPVISNVRITDLSSSGYTVVCDISDNGRIAKVAFPTWTVENDQDDIFDDWGNTALGDISNGTVSYRVNVSQHNGDVNCYYRTHIYAWDDCGNSSNEIVRDIFVDAQFPSIDSVNMTGEIVEAVIHCSNSNAKIYCAVYNNNGKLIAVHSTPVTNESNYQFQFSERHYNYAMVVVLDEDLRPICPSMISVMQ